jgi:hypothetical protein
MSSVTKVLRRSRSFSLKSLLELKQFVSYTTRTTPIANFTAKQSYEKRTTNTTTKQLSGTSQPTHMSPSMISTVWKLSLRIMRSKSPLYKRRPIFIVTSTRIGRKRCNRSKPTRILTISRFQTWWKTWSEALVWFSALDLKLEPSNLRRRTKCLRYGCNRRSRTLSCCRTRNWVCQPFVHQALYHHDHRQGWVHGRGRANSEKRRCRSQSKCLNSQRQYQRQQQPYDNSWFELV